MSPFSRHPPNNYGEVSLKDLSYRCAYCNREYFPNKKNRNHQKYCSSSCRFLAKKERDKLHKQSYRKKDKYKLAKKKQNRRYRKKKGWSAYINKYREENREKIKSQNRSASQKYYQKNRRRIAFRRSELRWQSRLLKEIKELKKVSH